jgi:Putative  PD-(D/E)XK family member, (DUF4420)
VRPTEAWSILGDAPERRMRVCVRMGGGTELIALRGGRSGAGEIALRLPSGVQDHRLEGPWAGIRISHFERDSEPDVRYLTVASDLAYQTVFGHLCDDLAVRVEGITDAGSAQARLLEHLRLWAGFLRPMGGRLDSRTARGLFGELRFLEDVMAPEVGWLRAALAWEGPTGAANDINLRPLLSIDVKTTDDRDQLATISSLEQLDPQGVSCMLIAQAVVSEGAGGTLGETMARVLAAAEVQGAGHLIRARLAQIGTLQSDDEGPLMQLVTWHFHRADDHAFPRLLRTALPGAIRQCVYQVDLAAHSAPRPDMQNVRKMIHQSSRQGARE